MSEIDSFMKDLTRQIDRIYDKAGETLKRQLESALESVQKRAENIQEQEKDGEFTQTKARVELLALMRKLPLLSMAGTLYDANKKAKTDVNNAVPYAFTQGLNHEIYGIEKEMGEDIGLAPLEQEDVEEWMEEEPSLYPVTSVSKLKDLLWNRTNLKNIIISSVVGGIAFNKLSGVVSKKVTNRNRDAMQQNKYMIVTGANNAGHQAGMDAAQDKGVSMMKEWIATLDFKTRDAHRRLDGQQVPVDKNFEVDGYELEFPRDPTAPAYLRCNCRCAYRRIDPRWDNKAPRRENIKNEDGEKPMIPYTTYTEWFEAKKQEYGAEVIEKQIKEMKREQARKAYKKRKRRLAQERKAAENQ